MKLQDKLLELKKSRKAILAANFYNYETLEGILIAVSQSKQPVILQLSESSIDYLGVSVAVSMAREALKLHGIEGWIHLDHGSSLERVALCLDAGFDSVMIDGSELPLEENIRISREAVHMAQKYGANVEAELGYVAKLGQEHVKNFTDPAEARYFTEQTGVSALAVAIGSAHGFYKEKPKLEIDLLKKINEITPVPLVLHGGSGIPDETLQEAIRNGISKINLATETKNTFMSSLKLILSENNDIDLRKVFPGATHSVTDLINYKLKVITSA
ncbi:MAG TPA: class II fructose-bisphosphate aldolase [Bacteroidales bacterium]|nr:class II fructose-bisphosphate aldolase [Bacteroidales bacterium]